ncbi:MAG: malate dehydrogenase [Alphaproteobacteria bacterium]|nr:malate dehydrogenase [Alphaproteobacteria bacterium]
MKSLNYHKQPIPGKIGTIVLKPVKTREDLALAYTPGVADACLAIKEDPRAVYDYTNKGRTVAIVTNGTAVLGLGNIGPSAGKPVMEGKAVLLKVFANVDALDVCVDEEDVERFVEVVRAISPTYGVINLEDIAAPACFEIERRLKEILDIPVFHDDQHGTAVCVVAGLIRATAMQCLDLHSAKIVFSGAGASALATARLLLEFGVKQDQITIVDSKGVIYEGRENVNEYKRYFASQTDDRTLADALKGANIFVGLSSGNVVSKLMVREMAEKPILFSLANPIPEISVEDVESARSDAIAVTGSSKDRNQVNNVMCFPFLLRAVIDVGAKDVTTNMLKAAAEALACVAQRSGRIMPDLFDNMILPEMAAEVARAAQDDGVATKELDIAEYKRSLHKEF